MSAPRTGSDTTSRFNVLYCVDLIAFIGILVIASRPDALAITASAAIVCLAAVIYRSTLGIKAYLSSGSAGTKTAPRAREPRSGKQGGRAQADAVDVPAKTTSVSWLRDAD